MAERAGTATGDMLRLFADGRPRTRAELVEETGLARTAVMTRLEQFFELGLIAHLDRAPSTGGRPSARLVFDPAVRSLLAIDLGAAHSTIALTDFDGRIIAERREELDIAQGPVAVLGHALDVCDGILAAAGVDRTALAGIGVGVPGPVEHASGRPVRPPIMPGWDGFDIPAFVRRRYDTTVLVDNDVNLLALGERASRFPHALDLMFVKVGTGIGAGIVSSGLLQRGALGSAGDLGHVQVPRTAPAAAGGQEGDLEAVAGGSALAAGLARAGRDVQSVRELIDLLKVRDPEAVEAARIAGLQLGEVLATCVSLLNPSVIVLGGAVALASPEILTAVRSVIDERSLPLATQRLDVVTAELGGSGGVRGAALMLRGHLLSPAVVDGFLEQLRAEGRAVR
ncbi:MULTISPECIES: ROK family protein [unclassified Rathayibacter]|uniref:ROK family protein n=1 Tax=unclassified Rathayibacter TaxID=2609250 RepID=UPI002157ACBB|nr:MULTISPECIES: ROK family protein [unclassified Rathayibacter]